MPFTVTTESWGPKSKYHTLRAPHAKTQVKSYLLPNLLRHVQTAEPLVVVDFACGTGAIAAEFARQATAAGYAIDHFVLVDVVQGNLDAALIALRDVLPAKKISTHLCNGQDFSDYKGRIANYLYCWDSMVHFDVLDVISYLGSLRSIVAGVAFFHHSNLDKITTNVEENPHHRNYMTGNLFFQLTVSYGHSMIEQWKIKWAEVPDLDCFSTIGVKQP